MAGPRFRIPSSSTLIAFESVARLGGVGRAAEELNTSQSAISRYLKHLEDDLGIKLFERVGRGVSLTYAGKTYLDVVSSALESLTVARQALRASSRDITIACTHEVSHLLLMPVFRELRRAIGGDVDVKILTCEYDAIPAMIHAGADIVFQYSERPPDRYSVAVVDESFVPVASPLFTKEFDAILRRAPADWAGVPRLALTKNNFGWATWDTWFDALDAALPSATTDTYDNYVYLLEAAAAGMGLALGWSGFVDRYIASGALVRVTDRLVTRPTKLYAVGTKKGDFNKVTRKCLGFLSTLNGIRETGP